MPYIVQNCPAREDICNYEVTQEGNIIETSIDTPNYCVKHKQTCDKIADCLVKQVIETAKKRDYLSDREALDDIANNFQIEEVKDDAG